MFGDLDFGTLFSPDALFNKDMLGNGGGFGLQTPLSTGAGGWQAMRVNDPLDLWGYQEDLVRSEQERADKAYSDSVINPEQLAREKFARFQEFGKPIEDKYMAGLFDKDAREGQVGEARGIVRGQFDNNRRALEQTGARYGQPTGDMADFQNRRLQIEQALNETETANTTRGLVQDRDLAGAHSMSAMGRGLSGQVGQAGLATASMSDARTAQANAAIDQTVQSQNQAGGSIIGGVLGAMI